MITQTQFDQISRTAYRLWGLNLTERKRQLVTSRLSKFLMGSGWASTQEYLRFLEHDATKEDQLEFFDLLSTNVTSFFREPQAFSFLERELWAPLNANRTTRPNREIRIWSAACSTGAEPFSIAMHAREHLKPFDGWTVAILGSDLATSALQTARRGIYAADVISNIDHALKKRYFRRGTGARDGQVKVVDDIRNMVEFEQLNLMDTWPQRDPFDVILCRNCMIYFDRETRDRLVQRFHDLLRPGGALIIGSSETLAGTDTSFKSAQPAVYVK